jgi:hypothetical protein
MALKPHAEADDAVGHPFKARRGPEGPDADPPAGTVQDPRGTHILETPSGVEAGLLPPTPRARPGKDVASQFDGSMPLLATRITDKARLKPDAIARMTPTSGRFWSWIRASRAPAPKKAAMPANRRCPWRE